MNLTISSRAKSLNSLRSGDFEGQQHPCLRQQKLISKVQSANQQQLSHSSSHLTKWLLSKCFTRFNSIVEEQPNIQQTQPKQPFVIHNLSGKKNKEDTVDLHSKNKINLLSAKSSSQPKSREIKIKLETCKEGKKNQNILKIKMKTLLAKDNIVGPLKTGLSNSCITNPRSFYQRIDLKNFQTLTNTESEISLKASLCQNGTSRIDSFIQSNLKDSRIKSQSYKSKTLFNYEHCLPSEEMNKRIFKKISESKNSLQDYIFQPGFNEYSKDSLNTSKSCKKGSQIQQNYTNSSANSFQSHTISKEINNICQSDSFQKMNAPEDEDDQDKAMEVFQYQSHDAHHHYESMFTIQQKNDEAFENQ